MLYRAMRTASLAALACLILAGCDATSTDLDRVVPDPDWSIPDGTASARVGGQMYQFRVYAQPSAYDRGEVVLRAHADGLDRTLMLTFNLGKGVARVNRQLTGFWDLGFCTPSRSYVLSDAGVAEILVTRYDPASGQLDGIFQLQVQDEQDPAMQVSFTGGTFSVKLRQEPFAYCIEG